MNLSFRILSRFLHWFFHLLYHQLAWMYDFVAWVVSLGNWKLWIYQVIPFLQGNYILELGHGPGHLQKKLLGKNPHTFGIDASPQMGSLAHQKLQHHKKVFYGKLARARAQALPFSLQTFNTIVATFPSEYIFDPQTAGEISRTLKTDGKLVILLSVLPSGKTPAHLLIKWLFNITGQTPLPETALKQYLKPFEQNGFEVHINFIELPGGRLLIVTASRND